MTRKGKKKKRKEKKMIRKKEKKKKDQKEELPNVASVQKHAQGWYSQSTLSAGKLT